MEYALPLLLLVVAAVVIIYNLRGKKKP